MLLNIIRNSIFVLVIIALPIKSQTLSNWTSGGNSPGATTETTYLGNTTAGHAICTLGHYDDQANSVTAVTDDASDTFVRVVGPINFGTQERAEVWCANNINAWTSPGVTWHYASPTVDFSIVDAWEISGQDKLQLVDSVSVATPKSSSGTSLSTNTAANTSSGKELIMGIWAFDDTGAFPMTAGSGYTSFNADASTFVEYKNVTAKLAPNATGTSSDAANWAGFIVPIRGSLGCDTHSNCYVRTGAGGTATGADWTNAYTVLPTTLVRDVTYYIAAGSYVGHNFNDTDSGTLLIYVKAATIAANSTVAGWSNAYQGLVTFACTATCGNIIEFSTDYYSFSGVYRSSTTGVPATDWSSSAGYGFKIDNSGSHKAQYSVIGGLGYGGAPNFIHDITLSYTDIKGSNPASDSDNLDTAIDFEGGSYNIDISYNYIHDEWIPFYIKGNHNHQNGGGFVFGTGDGNTIEYNYVAHNYSSSAFHSEGCSCSEGLTNFTIKYNYWVNMIGTAYVATPSGASYNSGNSNNGPWYIYGNVLMATAAGISGSHCGTGDGVLSIFDATFTNGVVYLLNNTIANFSGCNALNNGLGIGLGFTTPMASIYSANNLIWKTDVVTVINTGVTTWNGATFVSPVTWAYNSWFQIPDSSASNDTDSHKQTSSSDPFTDSSTYNWYLTGHTTTGFDTSGLVVGNSTDLLGNTRGSGSWDRGAFQFIDVIRHSIESYGNIVFGQGVILK